jgi:hypothetical protein
MDDGLPFNSSLAIGSLVKQIGYLLVVNSSLLIGQDGLAKIAIDYLRLTTNKINNIQD